MSTNITSFRFPAIDLTGKVHADVAEMIGFHDDAIQDLQQSIPSLKSQIDALKTGTTTTGGSSVTEVVSSESTVVTQATIGFVNNQTGVVAYTTQQSDYGSFILFSDASAIAVLLAVSPAITLPWFAILINQGAGLVTVTPSSGTISYPSNIGAATMPISQNVGAVIVFDGTNFDALLYPVPPANTPSVAHEWLNSYNATTGVFGQSQPAFTDISGTLAPGQLPATGISVTITTAQLTPTGTQGSMTYVDGILTAQVQAT